MSPNFHNQSERTPPPTRETCPSAFNAEATHRLTHTQTDRELLARLEWLDDLMFAAIDGDPASLQAAAEAWNAAREELGGEMLEESRLQYLRHAQSVWNELRSQPNHPPHKVFAAIEIISLLAGTIR